MLKIKFHILTILIFFCFSVRAEVINDIKINGNERITNQTIINFSEAKIGKNVESNELNLFLKNLYDTKFFEDVSINLKNNILTINVKEFPIIQQITINGIKAEKTIKI